MHVQETKHVSITMICHSYLTRADARLSILSRSRLVVGSSKANTPQLIQNVSANANRITNDARTCENGEGDNESQYITLVAKLTPDLVNSRDRQYRFTYAEKQAFLENH